MSSISYVNADDLSISSLTEKANSGNADAENNLGMMYQHGDGVEKNIEKAIEYYNIAGELGNPSAYKQLGNMYYENFEMQDKSAAMDNYVKAANLGDDVSALMVGDMYLGDYIVIPINIPPGCHWYKRVYDKGEQPLSLRLKNDERISSLCHLDKH